MKWVVLLLFGGIGLSAAAAGLVWGARRYALWKGGVKAVGTVVENAESVSTSRESGRERSSTSYYPIVEFRSSDGATRRFRGSTGSSAADYEVGAKVEVLYQRDDPTQAMITDFSQFWLGPLVATGAGLIFFGLGLGAFFLIADSDRVFGPAFHAQMDRARLFEMKKGIPLSAEVKSVKRTPGDGGTPHYLVVVRGGAPGGERRDFEAAPLSFDPGRDVVGKTETVYADPNDPARYYVHLDPLFAPPEAR